MLLRLLICCGLATVTTSTLAMTLYKSTDANGVVFFSDRQTPGAQAFVIQERKVERPMLDRPTPVIDPKPTATPCPGAAVRSA